MPASVAAEPSGQLDSPSSAGHGLIATHSGLRGRPGSELSGGLVEAVVRGVVELLRRRGRTATIGVARDRRAHGAALSEHAISAACIAGADVIDFGVASTPAAKLAARRRRLGGLVIVTGSHLSAEWNGLKLAIGPRFEPLDPRLIPAPGPPQARPGRRRQDDRAAEEHAEAVCAAFDAAQIRAAGLGVECTGGAGPGPELALERLGCRGGPPAARFVLDADGDRLALAVPKRGPLDAEVTLGLAVLALAPRGVVKGADTSRMVDRLVGARGGWVVSVPPGELHLLRAVARHGADLAGEGNGGVVVPRVGLARDGLAAGVAVLELMARAETSLVELESTLPRLVIRRSTVECEEPRAAAAALAALAAEVGAEPPGDPYRGVTVERPEGAWGMARLSATERVIRFTTEAGTEAEVDALHTELRSGLGER